MHQENLEQREKENEQRSRAATASDASFKSSFETLAAAFVAASAPPAAPVIALPPTLISYPKENTDTRAWARLLFSEDMAVKVLGALAAPEIGLDLDEPDDVALLDAEMLATCKTIGFVQRKKLIEAIQVLVANAK